MEPTKFSDDELIERVVLLAREYRRRFGKSLGITGEVGEYKASKLLGLKLASSNINEGYDAIDRDSKRVQIKSRILSRSSERTGVFSNYNFDYALLVLMSEDYKVTQIYKAKCRDVKKEIVSQSYKNSSLSVTRFKQLADPVFS